MSADLALTSVEVEYCPQMGEDAHLCDLKPRQTCLHASSSGSSRASAAAAQSLCLCPAQGTSPLRWSHLKHTQSVSLTQHTRFRRLVTVHTSTPGKHCQNSPQALPALASCSTKRNLGHCPVRKITAVTDAPYNPTQASTRGIGALQATSEDQLLHRWALW